jgi:Reverse transcriptase (RNA-dependent DNA polymerase)
MRLMDVVTTYLYRSLDNNIYMKDTKELKMLKIFKSKSQEIYYMKLKRSLYELKQSGRMWYNRLNEYLIKG